MRLTASDIARMIDISCVYTTSSKADIEEMVAAARRYGFEHVSVLQGFIPYTQHLLKGAPTVKLVGNVSFPSGSDSTSIKIIQARQLAYSGCDEIDMVMNIGKLRSGELTEVEEDVRTVIDAIQPIPVKVIIEIMLLTETEAKQACEISVRNGAAFIKTSTGWASRGTTPQDVRLVKAFVGDQIQVKASGGIRSLDMLLELYRAGARRFGVNHKSAIQIVEESQSRGATIEV